MYEQRFGFEMGRGTDETSRESNMPVANKLKTVGVKEIFQKGLEKPSTTLTVTVTLAFGAKIRFFSIIPRLRPAMFLSIYPLPNNYYLCLQLSFFYYLSVRI